MNIFPDEAFQISENLAEDEKFWEIIPLSKIDLSHNKINVIPDLFDTSLCETLQILKIRENVIENLPITLFQCIKLKELDIAVNSLSNLPPSIGNLNDLRILGYKHVFLDCVNKYCFWFICFFHSLFFFSRDLVIYLFGRSRRILTSCNL